MREPTDITIPMSDWDYVRLFLQLGTLVLTAKLLGDLVRRFGLPPLVGEVLAGIVLGPSILGKLAPVFQANLFPDGDHATGLLNGVVAISAPLFLLAAGSEIDLDLVRREWRSALTISVGGMLLPMIFGFVPAYFFPQFFDMSVQSTPAVFALFCAAALSITALPVTAKLLQDLGIFRTVFGTNVMAAAVFDDLFGWLIFALVMGLDHLHDAQNNSLWPVARMAGMTIAFLALMLTVGRAIANRVLPLLNARPDAAVLVAGILSALAMFGAAFTQYIGIHSLFGAFITGVALAGSPRCTEATREVIDRFVRSFLAPLFFATLSLNVDFFHNIDLPLLAAVFTIATLGKLIGCTLSARVQGWSSRESEAIGFAMNNRGSMEIILATIALREQIIGPRLFVALVIMAILTATISSSAVSRLMSKEIRESADSKSD